MEPFAVACAGTGDGEAGEGGDHDSTLIESSLSKIPFQTQDATPHLLSYLCITHHVQSSSDIASIV
jgi:hypothetical protein